MERNVMNNKELAQVTSKAIRGARKKTGIIADTLDIPKIRQVEAVVYVEEFCKKRKYSDWVKDYIFYVMGLNPEKVRQYYAKKIADKKHPKP